LGPAPGDSYLLLLTAHPTHRTRHRLLDDVRHPDLAGHRRRGAAAAVAAGGGAAGVAPAAVVMLLLAAQAGEQAAPAARRAAARDRGTGHRRRAGDDAGLKMAAVHAT